MKKIIVEYENFLLENFMDTILEFIDIHFNIEGNPTQGIMWLEHDDNIPYYTETVERDFENELFDERKRLFFPFSLPNFGEPIPCADGEEYVVDYQSEYVNEYDEDFEMDSNNIMGFLVETENNNLIISSAKYTSATASRGETIVVQQACPVFDFPMESFIEQFII